VKIQALTYTFLLLFIYSYSYSNEPQGISISSREIIERLTRLEVTIQESQKSNEIRFNSIEKRLDSMDKRLDSMDKRLDSMDKRLDDFKWGIGFFLLIGFAVIGFIWRTLLNIKSDISYLAENYKFKIEKNDIKQPEYIKLKSEFQLLTEKVERIAKYLNIPDNKLVSAMG